jgi:protein kinase A
MGNQAACQTLCSKRNPHGDSRGEMVSRADFKVHEAIGRGGFGKVLKVSKNGDFYAMKEMLKARVMSKKSVDCVKRELELM